MTKRNEKPSPHESSTDTIIGALEQIAKELDLADYPVVFPLALSEAAQRLDKLEKELSQLRGEK